MMSLDEVVDLVLFAFANVEQGDIMVQKALACTIQVLIERSIKFWNAIRRKIYGIRYGEKMYKTLLTIAENVHVIDTRDN